MCMVSEAEMEINSREKFDRDLMRYVREYCSMYGPVRLSILSQQFEKRARRFGVTVRDLIEADSRFVTMLGPKGGVNVLPNDP